MEALIKQQTVDVVERHTPCVNISGFQQPERGRIMWTRRLMFTGMVVFVLVMAALVVLIAMTGGLFVMQEL